MLTIAVAIIIIVAIYMFFHKIVYKRMMQKKLGRKVDDRELTSLTSWMNASDAPTSENREGDGKANQ